MVDVPFLVVTVNNPIFLIGFPIMAAGNLFHFATFLTDECYGIDLFVLVIAEYSFD